MELDIADLATNEKHLLKGFKVVGIFPYHLAYITTKTHIRLSRIRAQIRALGVKEPTIEDFYNAELQEKAEPLIEDYLLTGLVNSRSFGRIFRYLLRRKLKRCSHYHYLNLYAMIHKLDDPSFFLAYWKFLLIKDDTLIKEEK